MYLIFDTETTGLPKNWNAPLTDTDNWPRCIQIAWQLHDSEGKLVEHQDFLIKPEGFNIPYDAEQIHGISTELASLEGISLQEGLERFKSALDKASFIVGQNVGFDVNIMGCEFYRANMNSSLLDLPVLDTCTEKTALLCQIPGGRGGKFKLPTLTELHQYLFGSAFSEAHNATADVEATTRCFLELVRRGTYSLDELNQEPGYLEEFNKFNPGPIGVIGLEHLNLKKASAQLKKQGGSAGLKKEISSEEKEAFEQAKYAHLHNHTQYSILQSTIQIGALVEAAAADKMTAVALTDTGNMMAAFHFVNAVYGKNKALKEAGEQEITPIVGGEFFVCEDHLDKSRKDNGYQMVFLAKNKRGYENLSKMSSIAFVDGFYYVPRIDKKVVEQYKEDLIVLTGNLYGEVPNKILNIGEKQAEESLLWWKEQFGEDLYIELMRHGQEDEDHINEILLQFAAKHQIKSVATNNTFYLNKEDADPHDILLCVKDGEKQATPIGKGRGLRYGLPNHEYYFKSTSEMKALFEDHPESIVNIQEVVDKITPFELARDVLLPAFEIGEEFEDPKDLEDGGKRGENNYLKHITYVGAKDRYGEITDDIAERLDFELDVIAKTGYPGYFLIVEDFIRAARDMGVSVGPGRGSAAGSAVAYCLGITNIDPIKYDLLFERFLNPERVSMPDIDIDFDDEGRSLVMDYVIDKYGANQVAQIITYGTMAAKSAIRDTARVLDLPLYEADRIAKLIPGMKLAKIFSLDDKALKEKLRSDELEQVNELKKIAEGNDLLGETVRKARVLEGSLRNTGIHACGVIITPDDITKFVPVALAKDSDMYVTQFDNSVVENAGLLKMDFLGLKTLTLIKDSVKMIKAIHGVELDPESFPLDDEKTYELFQRGETIGIFQYESPGMQKYMRELKPTVFADLIAMNALYRPGPLEYIPSFINRKHGREEISYDLDACEEYLKETYGITVYQEQVMLLSQKLADFTKGEADVLRKAMGKKQHAVLAKMKPKFLEQASAKGHEAKKLEKIWTDWEAFASYAFNKSHSTCYAWIAYQTAYLKAHYPAEYMAAVLSNNMNDIKQVTFFMEECKRAGIEVLGPDVNESYLKFSVNKEGAIRFGLGAIKGVGSGAVRAIIAERKENGPYKSIFDLARRIDLRAANKKAFDSLVLAGGFDSFPGTHRAQYYVLDEKGNPFLEKVIKYGNKFQEAQNSSQVSLFGESTSEEMPEPILPVCDTWGTMELLAKEKEVVGMYISAHPLDDFKNELHFCNTDLSELSGDLQRLIGRKMSFGGILTVAEHRVSKMGKGWATFTLEDYSDQHEFRIFGNEYMQFRHFLVPNSFLFMSATMQKGWINKEGVEGEPRLKFNSFALLHDVLQEKLEKITIRINVRELTDQKTDDLYTLLSPFEGGKLGLRFSLRDPQEKLEVTLPSRGMKLHASNELLSTLDQHQIDFKIN